MSKVRSTRGSVTGYGKGRTRRWRWTARVWRESATQSEQLRRQGFATETDAREDMDRVLALVREGKTADAPAASATITLGAALERLLMEKARKKSIGEYGRIAERLKRALGADTPLHVLTAAKISSWRAERLAATSEYTKRQLSVASINRPLAVLRHLLKVAHFEWGVLAEVPRVRLEKEEQGRLRWLTHEEAAQLLDACRQSRNPDLLDLVTVAIYTGLRQSELLGLTWDRVDRSRGVLRLEVTKSGRRREVPFGVRVDEILARRQAEGGARVFKSSKWDSYRSAWERAVDLAQLDDLRFHDTRHTFASWLVQAGRPLREVQELLGHQTLAMTMRYAHLAPEHLRTAVSVLDDVRLPEVPAARREKAVRA